MSRKMSNSETLVFNAICIGTNKYENALILSKKDLLNNKYYFCQSKKDRIESCFITPAFDFKLASICKYDVTFFLKTFQPSSAPLSRFVFILSTVVTK